MPDVVAGQEGKQEPEYICVRSTSFDHGTLVMIGTILSLLWSLA